MDPAAPPPVARSRLRRGLWFVLGWVCVAVGTIGVVLPVLPSTGFFIAAASCFARSSPRFERWVLDLPRVGPLVRDYRAGLGMSRRAKAWAIGTMLTVCALSAALAVPGVLGKVAVMALGLAGTAYLLARVPTKERVLLDRPDLAGAD